MGVMSLESLTANREMGQVKEGIEDYGVLRAKHLQYMLESEIPVELRILKLWHPRILLFSSILQPGYQDMLTELKIAKPEHIGFVGNLKAENGLLKLVGLKNPELDGYSSVHFNDQLAHARSVLLGLADQAHINGRLVVAESL